MTVLGMPSMPSLSKYALTRLLESPMPPSPKCPRNGSAVTKVTGATSVSPALSMRYLTLKRNS